MGIGYMPEDRSLVPELIAQSDLNHSRRLVDAEFVIERGANVAPGVAAH